MEIGNKKVATIHYELKNGEGQLLDSSIGRAPLVYIQGIGMLIPGLENELNGKKKGDKITAVIPPDEAYGEYHDANVHIVPKSGFQSQGEEELTVGMSVQVESNDGQQIAVVTKIQGEEVTLDLNHPLAGETLHFSVEVMEVREATADELSHGHVHGPGGHHH
jgi:FKBP-type peptidyl-prolyl cis-trans isomerase SlyD